MEVKFKKLNKNAVLPQTATEFSGGCDVVATEIEVVAADFVICKLGFALQLPINYKVMIVPRSSLTKTQWVMQNSPGLGDADYRGEYQIRFRAIPNGIEYMSPMTPILTYPEFPYNVGDRVGQIFLQEKIPIEFDIVQELTSTERGTGGFGHTGL